MITKIPLSSYLPEYKKRYRYALYLVTYLILGLLSAQFENSLGGNISLWYLPNGLLFAMFLVEGRSSLLIGLLASFVADALLFPELMSVWVVLETITATLIYGLSANLISSARGRGFNQRLSRLRDCSQFLAISGSAVVLTAGISSVFMLASGRIASDQFPITLLSWAVGDALGILTLTPILMIGANDLVQRSRNVLRLYRQPKRNRQENAAMILPILRLFLQAAGIALVLWIVFGFPPTRATDPYYLCFLPLIWISLANGVEGSARGIAAINVGTMFAMILAGAEMNNLPIFMLIFSVTSLILGSVISEGKATEVTLRSSEQSLRSVYDNVYDAILIHEANGTILDVNDKLLSLIGTDRSHSIGHPVEDILGKRDVLPADLHERWALAVEGSQQLFEWNMTCADGRLMDMEFYLSRVQLKERWVVLSTIRDITNHKDSQRRQLALWRISEAASTAETPQALFTTFHEAIGSLMPAENFYICLLDRENNLLTFPYFVDAYDSTPDPMPTSRGLTEYVLRTGKAVLVDPQEFDSLVAQGEVESIGAPSIDWLGVPLKVQDVTIGVMAVQSYTEGVRFNEDNLNFLVLVSPHIAMAIEHRRAEETLQQQHDFIHTIYASSPDAILTMDLANRITDCNPATLELLECHQCDDNILGRSIHDFILPDDRQPLEKKLAEAMTEGVAKHIEFQLLTNQKQAVDVELSVSLIYDEFNRPSFFICHLIDITQRKQAERALRISEERYHLASLGANDGLWDWDLNSGQIYYSPRWRSMLGCEDEQATSPEVWFSRVHPDDLERLQAEIQAHLTFQTQQLESEYRICHADGNYRWMQVRGIGVSTEGNFPHRIAGSQTDITARKSTEQRLIHDALHDALTSLPNRVLFLDRLGQALKWCGRHPSSKFAVLFLDLDRFKVINDSLGHQAGDEILIGIARRLDSCLREPDTVARLSGDEFAILLQDVKGPADIIQVANRIQNEIARLHEINGQPIFTTASIGVALSDTGYELPEDMLRDADTAMYQAKNQGGGRYVIFNKDMHTNAVRLLELETDLRRALQNDQFELLYQPILSLTSSQIVGTEALLRWNHPVHGLRSPGEFLPLAEETGLIVPIGEWVLRSACKQLQAWHEAGLSHLTIAVNISDRQFQHQDLPSLISTILCEYNLQPEHLVVEITENINLMQTDTIEDALTRLNTLGVKIAMDDFGTGYASLNTLKRLAVNCVKIDRSFVTSILKSSQNDLIIASIIQMAHKLGFVVVAEGVETEQQLEYLRNENCDMIQGYIFSPPVSSNEFEKIVNRQSVSLLTSPRRSLLAAAD